MSPSTARGTERRSGQNRFAGKAIPDHNAALPHHRRQCLLHPHHRLHRGRKYRGSEPDALLHARRQRRHPAELAAGDARSPGRGEAPVPPQTARCFRLGRASARSTDGAGKVTAYYARFLRCHQRRAVQDKFQLPSPTTTCSPVCLTGSCSTNA